MVIRRNDTLKGDGNSHKIFLRLHISSYKKKRYSERRRKHSFSFFKSNKISYKKKRYSERRRKPEEIVKFIKNFFKIRRNDTLKGDGNFLIFIL